MKLDHLASNPSEFQCGLAFVFNIFLIIMKNLQGDKGYFVEADILK